jgi:hypothetical protein
MIDQLQAEYPVRQLCETWDCPPSTYYYQPQAAADDDLISAIEDMLMRYPFYGYRRIHKQLQRDGWAVGETRVRRVLKTMGHTAKIGRVRVRTTDSSHPHKRYPNLLQHIRPAYPDHVWVAGMTYIPARVALYLSGAHSGCLYAGRARLGVESPDRRGVDAGGTGTSLEPENTVVVSFGSGCSVHG